MNTITFGVNGNTIEAKVSKLLIWRISDLSFKSLELTDKYNHKILGINFNDSNLTKSVLTTSFRKEQKTLGQSTIEFLEQNLEYYDLAVLYPAGYDFNSIEFIIENSKEMPLLLLLDSITYFNIFIDESYGELHEYKTLTKNIVSTFKIS